MILRVLVAGSVFVFAFQNGTPVTVQFLTRTLPSMSVAPMSLVALASGLVVADVPLWLQHWQLRPRLRDSRRRSTDAPERPRLRANARDGVANLMPIRKEDHYDERVRRAKCRHQMSAEVTAIDKPEGHALAEDRAV